MSDAKIKDSLLLQLESNGFQSDFYKDLVNDYMLFWEIKKELQKNVKETGVTHKDYSSVGEEISKNNPSVKELTVVSKQMLQILKELSLTIANKNSGDDEDMI